MSKAIIRRSERIYSFLLKFYPTSYRQEFGEEMKYVFSESLKDAYRENGDIGIITLWTRTIFDTGRSLVTQHIENREGGEIMRAKRKDLIMQNKIFVWMALGAAFILMIPLVAMQFTREVDWKLSDFIIMGTLLFGMGSLFIVTARKIRKPSHRIAVAIAFLIAILAIWAHLAVGIVDSWPFAGS